MAMTIALWEAWVARFTAANDAMVTSGEIGRGDMSANVRYAPNSDRKSNMSKSANCGMPVLSTAWLDCPTMISTLDATERDRPAG